MNMRLRLPLVIAGLAALSATAGAQSFDVRVPDNEKVKARHISVAYQGGSEQSEHFTSKYKLGREGSVSVSNVSGDIVVTGGSGDEVSVEAIKRTRGGRGELGEVHIDVDSRAGRVDIRTNYPYRSDNRVSVDYTITVPASAAVDAHSVSGSVKITGVSGLVHAESVSGNVTTARTPKLESAKSVSGAIDLTDATADSDLNASSVSGSVHAKGLKARSLTIGTVSGDVSLIDVTCERLGAKSVSGGVEYSGSIVKSGRYDINAHSGTIRLTLGSDVGFELNANTFSGSIRSDLPLTIGGDTNRSEVRNRGFSNRSIRATFGDGSAILTVRTFSGDIVISKR